MPEQQPSGAGRPAASPDAQSDGTAPNGTPPNGTASNGTASSGTAPSPRPNEAAPDGSANAAAPSRAAAPGEAPADPTGVGESTESTDVMLLELEDRWRRAAADLDNLRKRYARELERERAAERNRAAAAFLPVLDNLELALSHAGSEPSAIVEGVRRVLDQGVAVLAGLGYQRHDDVGVPFDPNRHEVVDVVDAPDAEPGTVVAVLRPGYGDGVNQLRPAAVTVARGTG